MHCFFNSAAEHLQQERAAPLSRRLHAARVLCAPASNSTGGRQRLKGAARLALYTKFAPQVANEILLLSTLGRHPNLLRLHGWAWLPAAACGGMEAAAAAAASERAAAAGNGAADGGKAAASAGGGAAEGGADEGARREERTLCLLLERCEGGTLGSVVKVGGAYHGCANFCS